MCIVVDVNVIPFVFDTQSRLYTDFQPVQYWLENIKGVKMVIGGSKYGDELSKMSSYLFYIGELERKGKIARIADELVDVREAEIADLVSSTSIDDGHLIALLGVSGCLLICTLDNRSNKFITDQSLYKDGRRRKIYKRSSHCNLLSEQNIISLRNLRK